MKDTIKIALAPDEYVALARLAERQCRPVPMQARHLVIEALRRTETLPGPHPQPEQATQDDSP